MYKAAISLLALTLGILNSSEILGTLFGQKSEDSNLQLQNESNQVSEQEVVKNVAQNLSSTKFQQEYRGGIGAGFDK